MRLSQLPHGWGTDAYLLGEHAHAEVHAAWADADALVAVLESAGHGCGLYGLGQPDVVARLCARAVAEDPAALARSTYASLARGSIEALDAETWRALGFLPDGSAWDWMWTRGPLTASPGHAQRLPLGVGTVAEVAECLARAHPTASTTPDDDRSIGWWGAREDGRPDGRLMAVVGGIRFAPGLPAYLVSLGVDPATRGQGLAGMVMSAAVCDCLELEPDVGPRMVGLGLYASNDIARRLYLRLGFTLRHRFESHRRAA